MPRWNSTGLCSPISTPNSSMLFRSTSAISTWITTCGSSASSSSISRMMSGKYRGVALISSLLVIGSGTTTTSRSMSWNGVSCPALRYTVQRLR